MAPNYQRTYIDTHGVARRAEVFAYPRRRTPDDWRRSIELARADAAVVLDAYLADELDQHPTLADQLPWLIRLAVEDRRLWDGGHRGMTRRWKDPWEFRWRTKSDRSRMPAGDVFCLFCCEPLARDVRDRNALGDRIDFMTAGWFGNREFRRHIRRCALQHLAGLRTFAAWGSVNYPDPEVAA